MLQEHRLEGQEFLKSNFLYCTVILFAPNLTHARTPCKDTMQRRTDRQTDEHKHTHRHTPAPSCSLSINYIIGRVVPRHVMGILGWWVTGNECAGRWYNHLLPTWTLNHINLNPIDEPGRHCAPLSFLVLAQGFSSKVGLTVFILLQKSNS